MKAIYPTTAYQGLLVIGDPHLEGRVPGFRKDEYPLVVLEKLRWCFNYATSQRLLPVILGDLFHLPRDNPNWLLVELIQLFDREVLGIYGNHDIRENEISDHDSLSILAKAGRIRLLSSDIVYRGRVGGRPVVIGGTAWGQRLPHGYDGVLDDEGVRPLVFWLVHHDLILPGYEEQGRIKPRELPGIDVVINGHIHRRLENVRVGRTLWMTPGNISRRSRSDATKQHIPSVQQIKVKQDGPHFDSILVPHRPYEEVFHAAMIDEHQPESLSAFVAGLAELQARRTDTGEGLAAFLEKNLGQFENEVAAEIRKLAKEVTENG